MPLINGVWYQPQQPGPADSFSSTQYPDPNYQYNLDMPDYMTPARSAPSFDPSNYYQNYGAPDFMRQAQYGPLDPGLVPDRPTYPPGPAQPPPPGGMNNASGAGYQDFLRDMGITPQGPPLGTQLGSLPGGSVLDYYDPQDMLSGEDARRAAIQNAATRDMNKNTPLPDRGPAGGSFMPGGWQPGMFGGDRTVSPPPPGQGFLAGGQQGSMPPQAAQATMSALASALQSGAVSSQQAEQVASRVAQALGIPVRAAAGSGSISALDALGLNTPGGIAAAASGGGGGAAAGGRAGAAAGGRTGALGRRPTGGTGGKSTGVVGGLEQPQIPWGERGKSGGYVQHPGDSDRLVKLNPEGHGDFGAGYDSLGNRAVGSMGTGVPDRVLGQQFETMKMMGLVDWTGSLGTWKEAGMPKTGDYNPQDIADYVAGRIDMWELQAKRQGGAGAQPPAGQTPGPNQQVPGHPGSTGQYNPMNWMIPGMGLGQYPPTPGGQYPPMNPGFGDGGLQPALPGRDGPPNTPPPANNGQIPINRDDAASVDGVQMRYASGGGQGDQFTAALQRQKYQQTLDPNALRAYGMTVQDAMNEYDTGMAQRSAGQQGMPNGGPYGYDLPYFTQPSYTANMTPEQLQQFLAYNNSVALPWANYMGGMYQYNRNFDEDVRRNDRDYGRGVYENDRNFGEDVRRDNRNFGEDQFRDRRNYGEDVRRFDLGFNEDTRRDNRNFGEDTRRFDTTFGEGQRQFNANFGEGRRQFDTTFGEGQRQFNESLNWQKKADALRSFGARQMPNVRQMSYR